VKLVSTSRHPPLERDDQESPARAERGQTPSSSRGVVKRSVTSRGTYAHDAYRREAAVLAKTRRRLVQRDQVGRRRVLLEQEWVADSPSSIGMAVGWSRTRPTARMWRARKSAGDGRTVGSPSGRWLATSARKRLRARVRGEYWDEWPALAPHVVHVIAMLATKWQNVAKISSVTSNAVGCTLASRSGTFVTQVVPGTDGIQIYRRRDLSPRAASPRGPRPNRELDRRAS